MASSIHINPETLSSNPAITVAMVAGLAVPGALVEIEAVAAVPAAR